MKKIIISVAPIKSGDSVNSKHLAYDIQKCVDAGASICHLHCRNPKGELTSDIGYMSECFDEILKTADVIVQASTGGVSEMSMKERCRPLEYSRTESTSLNGGSLNLGEAVYKNSFSDIRYCANEAYKRRILPEIEVFDISMFHNIKMIKDDQPFYEPLWFNLVFGHKGGMQATVESLSAFVSFVPKDAIWGITHFERDNWTFLAAAIAMGASVVRIGFEDSPYLSVNRKAEYNFQLVEKLSKLIKSMDLDVACPKEARCMLNIRKRDGI